MEKSEEQNIKTSTFSFDKVTKSLTEVNATLNDISTEAWNNSMLEFVKIFNSMGSAMSMAFSDITSKVAIIRQNKKTFPEVQGEIISMTKYEISLGLQRLNGENPKEAPEPKYKKYESTTRTVLRLMWFLDFTSAILDNLSKDRKLSLTTAAKSAYSETLGPHHPLLVRTAAGLAMMACPNRDKLLNSLFPGVPEEDRYRNLDKLVELIVPIKKALWKYYEENDLTKLP